MKTTVFTSGTQEITAILAGQLAAAYVGPNPAINAWQKSGAVFGTVNHAIRKRWGLT